MPGKRVSIVRARNAEEFLDNLSLRSTWLREVRPNRILFRGQPDSRFKLIPAVFREGAVLRYKREWIPTKALKGAFLIRAEIETLRVFCFRIDEAGLSLPEQLYPLNKTFNALEQQFYEREEPGWPPDSILPVLGLAQHYGIPTRLLDWSRSALTAAYFAAIGSLAGRRPGLATHKQRVSEPPPIALWALRHRLLERGLGQAARGAGREAFDKVAVINVPRAGNPNLYAQRGVFTLTRGTLEELRLPLDQVVARISPGAVMRKYTLPGRQAPKPLRLLAQEGVSAATLFPGYGGAAKGLLEERMWDKRSSPKALIRRELGLSEAQWLLTSRQ